MNANSNNISLDEVCNIIHKSKDFVIQAIENGSFPGSFAKSKSGRRNVHIPRKAFNQYMNNYYRTPTDELVAALVERLANK